MNENTLPRLKAELDRAERAYASAVAGVNRLAVEDLTDPDTVTWENFGTAVTAAAKYAGRVTGLRHAVLMLEI